MQKLNTILELWNLRSSVWNRSTSSCGAGKMLQLFPLSWNKKDYHYPLKAVETPVECGIFFAFLGWKCFQYMACLMLSCRSATRTSSVRSDPPERFKTSQLLCLYKCFWVYGCRNKNVKQVLTFFLGTFISIWLDILTKLDISHNNNNYHNYGFPNILKTEYGYSIQDSQLLLLMAHINTSICCEIFSGCECCTHMRTEWGDICRWGFLRWFITPSCFTTWSKCVERGVQLNAVGCGGGRCLLCWWCPRQGPHPAPGGLQKMRISCFSFSYSLRRLMKGLY